MFSLIKLPRSLYKTIKLNLWGKKQDVQYEKTASVFI